MRTRTRNLRPILSKPGATYQQYKVLAMTKNHTALIFISLAALCTSMITETMGNSLTNSVFTNPITPIVTAAASGFALGYEKTSKTTLKNVLGAAGTVVAGTLIAKQNPKNKRTSHLLHVSLANFAVFLGTYSLGKICQSLKNPARTITLVNGILQGICGWYAANATTTAGRLCALWGSLGLLLEERILLNNTHDSTFDEEDDSDNVPVSSALCFLGGVALRTAAPQTIPNHIGL